MIPAIFPNWGERSWLHDKSLQYVMSLDLLYHLPVHPRAVVGTSTRLPLLAVPPPLGAVTTYRTHGPLLFRAMDRIEREVPEARLLRGQDALTLKEEGAVELNGRLLLEVDTNEPIALSYTGELSLNGGTMQLATPFGADQVEPNFPPRSEKDALSGSAFVATKQEATVPKYRWLSYNQFVGIGRVKAFVPKARSKADRPPWLFSLSFDLYLGL